MRPFQARFLFFRIFSDITAFFAGYPVYRSRLRFPWFSAVLSAGTGQGNRPENSPIDCRYIYCRDEMHSPGCIVVYCILRVTGAVAVISRG